MSDENNEHDHEGHAFVFPLQFGPTKEQVEQARMNNEANAHETRQFFDSLTAEQLKKLNGLFAMCYTSEGDAAQYFMGIISGFLDQKHKLCLACGKNHDEELHKFAPVEESKVSPTPVQSDKPVQDAAERFRLMDEYGLYEPSSGRFACRNCGTMYVSLEDRMLRRPGKAGCSGCIEREKWG